MARVQFDPTRDYPLGSRRPYPLFLDDSAFGIDLAKTLDLPPPNWTAALVRARAWHKRVVLRWLNRVPGARGRRSLFATFFAQRLIMLQHPDRRLPFEVPPGFFEKRRPAQSNG